MSFIEEILIKIHNQVWFEKIVDFILGLMLQPCWDVGRPSRVGFVVFKGVLPPGECDQPLQAVSNRIVTVDHTHTRRRDITTLKTGTNVFFLGGFNSCFYSFH